MFVVKRSVPTAHTRYVRFELSMTVPVLTENMRLFGQSRQRGVMDLCLIFD